MKKYTYYVTVSADNKEQADKVINHRLNHDEDYGFAYRLNLSDTFLGFVPSANVVGTVADHLHGGRLPENKR